MELSLRWRRWNGNPSSKQTASGARPQARPLGAEPGRREPSPAELEGLGLGVLVRPFRNRANEEVRRIYCLSCGRDIDSSRRHEGPLWARCPSGCNASDLRPPALD